MENNVLKQRISYPNLDIAKFLCSLLVIMIHTNPFVDYPIAHFYIINVAARVAVPLFFAISGFLLFGRMSYSNGKLVNCPENRSRMLRYLKKTVSLYLGWSLATLASMLPGWYQSGWWGWTAVKDALHTIFFQGTFHLWYLLALIWAVPMMYVLLCMIPLRRLRVIAVALWLIHCLSSTYNWLLGNRDITLFPILENFLFVIASTRVALPMLVFGASAAVDRNIRKPSVVLNRFLCLSGIWICEASFMYFLIPGHNNFVYTLVAPFFVYGALDFLTTGKQVALPTGTQRRIREINLVIYCLHPIWINLFKLIGMEYGPRLWFFTTVFTVVFAYIWARVKDRRIPAGK